MADRAGHSTSVSVSACRAGLVPSGADISQARRPTREEIDREKYALKVLRGDFEQFGSSQSSETALAAVEA